MTLKESIAADTDVFINFEEFGEVIEIDGVELPAIIIKKTGELLKPNISSRNGVQPELHNEPLIGESITVYFKTLDYTREHGRIPQNLEFCRINGKRYKVAVSKDEMGITRLDCTADRMPNPRIAKLPGLYDGGI